jgi:rfaE bifunctional protein kinase chain/domain
VVRGQEFKNTEDSENHLIEERGIRLFFGSGSTHISEENLRIPDTEKVTLRQTFMRYAAINALNAETLKEALRKFSDKRVTVVGDLIVDEFVSCQSIGMSQEDPVIVSTPIATTRYIGGAGIVAAHCQAMGAIVNLVSLVGKDEPASWAKEELSKYQVKSHFVIDESRPTVVKQRFKNSNQTLFRLTHFRSEEAGTALLEEISQISLSLIENSDLIIFSDFGYGTTHPSVVSRVMHRVREVGTIFTAADSQSSSQVGSLEKFKGVQLVTPTEHEARIELRNETDGIAMITQKLSQSLDISSVILKLGADGVLLGGFSENNEAHKTNQIPAANQNAIDVSGAGDSLLAVSSLAMASGCKLYESAFLGSIAAGIQVSRRGNIPIKEKEVEEIIERVFLV